MAEERLALSLTSALSPPGLSKFREGEPEELGAGEGCPVGTLPLVDMA